MVKTKKHDYDNAAKYDQVQAGIMLLGKPVSLFSNNSDEVQQESTSIVSEIETAITVLSSDYPYRISGYITAVCDLYLTDATRSNKRIYVVDMDEAHKSQNLCAKERKKAAELTGTMYFMPYEHLTDRDH
ncbi:hypothetical protein GPECTOR_146g4 [Gonium pectorale]|uniref:Uncharacterized protein n=1 Tax=Gonium pectorale TaxID=33097 RepID=A0A150FXV7_GONPE|nr:hypothetical protein GPECTOR_146g4 [Gonium pectorale]|eukprot:KXZ42439.1 hypothetical protein GPECTOR_146g4 [Gonium pectorale]